MKLLQADDTKQFMQKLIRSSAFDHLLIYEMSMDVLHHFEIDGSINEAYLSTDEKETYLNQKYVDWASVKPFISAILKQSHTPTSMKMTFILNDQATNDIQSRYFDEVHLYPVQGFLMNITFDGQSLKVTTGINYKQFTMDKSLEHAFDQMIGQFFKKNELLMIEI